MIYSTLRNKVGPHDRIREKQQKVRQREPKGRWPLDGRAEVTHDVNEEVEMRLHYRMGRRTGASAGPAAAGLGAVLWFVVVVGAIGIAVAWPLVFIGGVLGSVVEGVWLATIIALAIGYWRGRRKA